MKKTNIIVSLSAILITGCTSLRPLTSKPPESAIELKSPAVFTELFATISYPSGIYRSLYEDDGGFYYQAPAKVISRDIVTSMVDGGLYVERNKTEPTKFYYIYPDSGQPVLRPCKSLPEHILIP